MPPKRKQRGEIQDRLVLVMLNEACRLLEENVVGDPSQIDLALIFGIGSPILGGILRYADAQGIKLVEQKLDYLSRVAGENYRPSPLLVYMASPDRPSMREIQAAKNSSERLFSAARVLNLPKRERNPCERSPEMGE